MLHIEDYEYEYGPVQTQSSNLNSNPEQYTSSVNYTTDSVATITRGMCETTLDSTPQFPSHDTFIDVRNPGLSNEKFDPREYDLEIKVYNFIYFHLLI